MSQSSDQAIKLKFCSNLCDKIFRLFVKNLVCYIQLKIRCRIGVFKKGKWI
jgi:hypothetical protein